VAQKKHLKSPEMGIYLTQVTTTCSVSGGGRLSARFAGAGASLFNRGGLPGVFVSTALAGRFLLPTLRGSEGMAGLGLAMGMRGLPSPGFSDLGNDLSRQPIAFDFMVSKRQNRIGVDAAGPSGRGAAQTLAAGNSSGRSERGASGCLSRRVHVPIQSPQVAQPRQTFLPIAGTGRRCQARSLQISGQMRNGRKSGFLKPQDAGVTLVT